MSPAVDLADELVCGWKARTEGTHLLVPDGCIDILWIAGVGIRVSRECRRISTQTPTGLLACQAPDWHGGATLFRRNHVRNVQAQYLGGGGESAA